MMDARLKFSIALLGGACFVFGCGSLLASPYTAKQLECVAEAGTRVAADECRCSVRAAYGHPCDAGGDR